MSDDRFLILQQAIQNQGYAWKAGPTPLSSLPPERHRYHLGLRLEPAEVARVVAMLVQPPLRAAEFPPAWDWRAVDGANWMTSVSDQDECGACVAFSVVAIMETLLKRYYADPAHQPDLSEAYLFFCGCGNCCEKGWWPTYALDFAQQTGVPDEACFPYEGRYTPCARACTDWQSRVVKVTGWQEVIEVGQRKEWLATYSPMVAGMAIYEDFFDYVGGVYRHTQGSLAGYHAICIAGYSEEEACWIGKNSWGTEWGEAGWCRIGYGECGIDTQFAMYGIRAVDPTPPLPEPPPPEPSPPPSPPSLPGCNALARALNSMRGRQP